MIAPPDCDGLTPREAVEQLWGASTRCVTAVVAVSFALCFHVMMCCSGVVCPLMLLEGPAMGQPGAGVHASLCGDSERVAVK